MGRTCLECYTCCLCVLRRTSKLAKKLTEEHFKRAVTDVGNIYNVRLGGEHCCEVSLNSVLKSITIQSLTSTLYPYTHGLELNSHLVTLAASLGLSPKLGKATLDFLL